MTDRTVDVVVCFRSRIPDRETLSALDALDRSGLELRVVLVDNSRDGLPDAASVLRAALPNTDVDVVRCPRPGLSHARNVAIDRSGADYVLVTDSDSIPAPDWAQRMVETMEREGAALAGGRAVLRGTGAPRIPRDLIGFFVPGAVPTETTALRAPYWIIGCNLGIARASGLRFDERFGAVGRRHHSCEDLVIAESASAAGLRVIVQPAAVVRRTVHRRDLGIVSLLARGYLHGASMARAVEVVPELEVHDDLRLSTRSVIRTILVRGPSIRWRTVELAKRIGFARSTRRAGKRSMRRAGKGNTR